jgi:TonB family protein
MRVIISVLIFFTGYTVNAQDTIIEKSTSYYVVPQKTTYEETINPKYNGGVEAMNQFIAENIRVPGDAKMAGLYGKVYVAFKVTEDGSLIDVEISQGISESMNQEAIRIVKLMPAWIPGTKGGKNTTMRYYIPVEFKR